jgi:DNA-binding FrmR family transcriptional regulator
MHSDRYTKTRNAASLSVRKAHGVIEKISKMIEEGKYCPEVIQQVDAAIGLLKSSKKSLLMGHLDHCLLVKMKDDKEQAINELVKIFDFEK